MPTPICKIAQVTGEVPLECLFSCHQNCKEDHKVQHPEEYEDEPSDRIECRRCHETGLHWQAIVRADGKPSHALFNSRNRKHVCNDASPDADGFEVEG